MTMRAHRGLLAMLTALGVASFAACTTAPDDTVSAEAEALPVGGRPPNPGDLQLAAHVLTQHNNAARTGATTTETTLNTANVNFAQFGRLYEWPVIGQVYAQPLYVTNEIDGKDVLYVATESNYVYAFDAQGSSATPLRQRQIGEPVDVDSPTGRGNIFPQMGITGTPVIDLDTRTMFVVAAETEHVFLNTVEFKRPVFRLHALDIDTLLDRPGSPVDVAASVDTGDGKMLAFKAAPAVQRTGLLLTSGDVWIAFGSNFGDYYEPARPDLNYEGWVMSYSRRSLAHTGAFVTSPFSGQAGIWQAGAGLAGNRYDDVFGMSGNPLEARSDEYGDAIFALRRTRAAPGIRVTSRFIPSNAAELGGSPTKDFDLGSSGPILLPGTRHLVAGGKEGVLYVTDQANLGGASGDTTLQRFKFGGEDRDIARVGMQIVGAPAYWNQHVYVWPQGSPLYSFKVHRGGTLDGLLDLEHPEIGGGGHIPGTNGAFLSVSSLANRRDSGIVWANVMENMSKSHLVALDASDITKELWNSDHAEDALRLGARMATPTVAAGRVFVGTYQWPGTSGAVSVYGLLPTRRDPSTLHAPPTGCKDGGPRPTAWSDIYATYFAGSSAGASAGHCAECHTWTGGGKSTAQAVFNFPADTPVAFRDALLTFGLVNGADPKSSALGDPSRTPLYWFEGTHGGTKLMPYDGDGVCDVAAQATILGWLTRGAPAL